MTLQAKLAEMRRVPGDARDLDARFGSGTFWNAIAAVTTQGAVFLANLIVANRLGSQGFGEFSILYATLLAATGMAQVATGVTATKYVAEFRESSKVRAGRVIVLCSLVALVGGGLAMLILASGAPWLTANALNAPHIGGEMALGGVFLFFAVMNGYQQGALAGLEAYRRLTWASVVYGLAHIGAIALGTYFWGLWGSVAALAVSGALRWLFFSAALRAEAGRCGIVIN